MVLRASELGFHTLQRLYKTVLKAARPAATGPTEHPMSQGALLSAQAFQPANVKCKTRWHWVAGSVTKAG